VAFWKQNKKSRQWKPGDDRPWHWRRRGYGFLLKFLVEVSRNLYNISNQNLSVSTHYFRPQPKLDTLTHFRSLKFLRRVTNCQCWCRKQYRYFLVNKIPQPGWKTYVRPEWSKSTFCRPKSLKHHTLWGITCLYSPYIYNGVSPNMKQRDSTKFCTSGLPVASGCFKLGKILSKKWRMLFRSATLYMS